MGQRVEVTRTLPLHPTGVFLQWDVVGVHEDVPYLFDVARSGSPEGPWEVLAVDLEQQHYVDQLSTEDPDAPNLLSMFRDFFYRVSVHLSHGEVRHTVTSVEPRLTGRFRQLRLKMLRDHMILLRKLHGTEIAVCKKKRWGPRCPVCFDRYTKEIVRANCTVCYGTSFPGGYYEPIITLARRLPTQKHKDLTPHGETEVRTTQFTMLDAPLVEPGDLVVSLRDNRRFQVKTVSLTELKTVLVHQEVLVSELSRSSIEFRISVDPLRTPPLF